ncbi:MAG: hypothetical protein ACRDH8_08665 [Actinomycetota bacterium]
MRSGPAGGAEGQDLWGDVLGPLRVVWATLNGPAGKRLATFVESRPAFGAWRPPPRRCPTR